MILLLIFIAVPIIEIALFIAVDDVVGLWPTLATVVVTAIIGTLALRSQGRGLLKRALQGDPLSNDVGELVGDGLLLGAAGLLLLTPGFFTDAVGFALLIPTVRRWVWRFVGRRISVQSFGARQSAASPNGTQSTHRRPTNTSTSATTPRSPTTESSSRKPSEGVEDAVVLDDDTPNGSPRAGSPRSTS